MAYSLFVPLPGLPWYLWPVWPLIFWRIQRLKAWFQAHGGPGAQMMWGVDARGRVTIMALSDDLTGRGPAPLPAPGPSRARVSRWSSHHMPSVLSDLAAPVRA